MIEYYLAPLALLALLPFVFHNARSTLFTSLSLMCNLFDLAPKKIGGIELWDVGVVILLAGLFRFRLKGFFDLSGEGKEVWALAWYFFYLVAVFAASLLYYRYPMVETVQASRQMVLGYLTFFAIRRYALYDRDGVWSVFFRLYPLMYCLLILYILQYFLNIQIFYGYLGDFEGAIRSIPVFLPIAYAFFWLNMVRLFSGERISFSDALYIAVTAFATLITFTRGIYFSVLLTVAIMFLALFKTGTLNWKRASLFMIAVIALFGAFISSGSFDKYFERAETGVAEIYGAGTDGKGESNFSFRMLLLGERAEMVAERNPLIGFGFLHENAAQRDLKYLIGTKTDDGEKAFHTPDIAWANILINSGYGGLAIFCIFVCCFCASFFKVRHGWSLFPALRLSIFLQLVSMIILMFNGPNFTLHLQIPMLLLVLYNLLNKTDSLRADVAVQC